MFIFIAAAAFVAIGVASSLAPKDRQQELYSPNKPWAPDAGRSERITRR